MFFLPGKQELKVMQYADDITLYLSHRTQLKHLFSILDRFQEATGLQINKSKTKCLLVGGLTNRDECHHLMRTTNFN